MSKPYLFTFWEPVKGTPAYIELALSLFEQHLSSTFQHVHLDLAEARNWSERIDEFLRASVPRAIGKSTSIEGRQMALFTDLLRIDLLSNYGGLWLDADTIVMPQAAKLADTVTNVDFFCSESEQLTLANGVIGGKKSSPFLHAMNTRMTERLAANNDTNKLYWGEMGFRLIEHVFLSSEQHKVCIAPFGLIIQNTGDEASSIYSSADNYHNIVAPDALALSMSNSSTPEQYRELSTQALLSADTVFATFCKQSMEQTGEAMITSGPSPRFLNYANYLRSPIAKRKAFRDEIVNLKQKLSQRTEQLNTTIDQRNNATQKLKSANARYEALVKQNKNR